MPKQGKRSNSRWGTSTFINHKLSRDEKKEFVEWRDKTADQLAQLVESVLVEGYRMSMKYNEVHQFFSATFTPYDDDNVNSGYILSSKGGDIWTALWITLYKHYELANKNVWLSLDSDDDWG